MLGRARREESKGDDLVLIVSLQSRRGGEGRSVNDVSWGDKEVLSRKIRHRATGEMIETSPSSSPRQQTAGEGGAFQKYKRRGQRPKGPSLLDSARGRSKEKKEN